tara:strand:+ start:10144 stop:10380 length:237 start_codon:yes stop_codon:yes gene_type:complete
MIRKIRNFVLLLRYWSLLTRLEKTDSDAGSEEAGYIAQEFTLEEIAGVEVCINLQRFFSNKVDENRENLKQLKSRLPN